MYYLQKKQKRATTLTYYMTKFKELFISTRLEVNYNNGSNADDLAS